MRVINQYVQDNYAIYNGDSVEILAGIPATVTGIWVIVERIMNFMASSSF